MALSPMYCRLCCWLGRSNGGGGVADACPSGPAPNGGTGIDPVMSCMEPRLWLMLTRCNPVEAPQPIHGM
ncbi:hypothetical protein BDP81DRAFT_441530 [Colletotrichum phormii]|uniref:Uncharacterized protein n=1 Tax=Colletotrichum phormii TaxID=359342 RepID=A0AAI9ZD73_9PEZI|nr:uncharacterized protein BDP81DRAFT_441530 [Colletotrichum phormii]KAK1622355.1 hypothetical protein BDP81DRAFT_441530 [Colletotrichum phormii]